LTNHNQYIFTSERLGFRPWRENDVETLSAINAEAAVMEFFPSIITKEKTAEFITRMQDQYIKNGYCYFAIDILENGEFIGFIGLSEQTYEAEFTPCIDIGWRIKSSQWNKGFATEGARKCLDYAANVLGIESIYSIAPKINYKSQHIMAKIGMHKLCEFSHPYLKEDKRLKTCVLFKIDLGRVIT
jgi:RimJ/RimL family protein N-acetyltransferase